MYYLIKEPELKRETQRKKRREKKRKKKKIEPIPSLKPTIFKINLFKNELTSANNFEVNFKWEAKEVKKFRK